METLEARVAVNMRARRLELGLTQEELAKLALTTGAKWSQPKVALVETGRRELGLGEALLLGNILGIGLERLVLGPDPVDAESVSVAGTTIPVHQLRRMLAGEPTLTLDKQGVEGVAGWHSSLDTFLTALTNGHRRRLRQAVLRYGLADDDETLERVDATAHGYAEHALARHFKVTAIDIAAASLALWGHRVLDERALRHRDQSKPASKQHITDQLKRELESLL